MLEVLPILFVLAAVPAPVTKPTTAPTSQPAEQDVFTLRAVNGRFVLSSIVEGRVTCGPGRYWCNEDGQQSFDDYHPRGYFSGRVCIRREGDHLQLCGWREVYRDWQVIQFSLEQSHGEVRVEYKIRTPVGQPDVTLAFAEPCVDLMLIRHPELQVLLAEVLKGLGGSCEFSFDPTVHAQLDPTWKADKADERWALEHLDGLSSPDWRVRDRAEALLVSGGRGVATYLMLGLDRRGLSGQQNLAIDRVIGRYPRLNADDILLCRRNPDILVMGQPTSRPAEAGEAGLSSTGDDQQELGE